MTITLPPMVVVLNGKFEPARQGERGRGTRKKLNAYLQLDTGGTKGAETS